MTWRRRVTFLVASNVSLVCATFSSEAAPDCFLLFDALAAPARNHVVFEAAELVVPPVRVVNERRGERGFVRELVREADSFVMSAA